MATSRYEHAICAACWARLWPDREPVTMIDVKVELCCFCGFTTASGIYVRVEPVVAPCGGVHR